MKKGEAVALEAAPRHSDDRSVDELLSFIDGTSSGTSKAGKKKKSRSTQGKAQEVHKAKQV